uniref:Golgin subfamily A member 7 n=1 Tax=Naja naja TaxID=35670 RepID=A0A8C6YBQ0_NAJNA
MRSQQPPVASKVFIQRDYSNGTKCQFQTKFPPELENRIDRQQFEETVQTLNNLYAEAEKLGSQSYLEGAKQKIYTPQGLLLTDPIERGLRVVEITIYEDRGVNSGRYTFDVKGTSELVSALFLSSVQAPFPLLP